MNEPNLNQLEKVPLLLILVFQKTSQNPHPSQKKETCGTQPPVNTAYLPTSM
jgi:hypothetical protein